MKIQHENEDKRGTFFIDENGERLAELTHFESAPGEMTIDHTEVSPKLRGEGIGEDLVAEAVKFARKDELKIVPTCSYAKKILEEAAEYKDVLA